MFPLALDYQTVDKSMAVGYDAVFSPIPFQLINFNK
jgi:hypothetical protein